MSTARPRTLASCGGASPWSPAAPGGSARPSPPNSSRPARRRRRLRKPDGVDRAVADLCREAPRDRVLGVPANAGDPDQAAAAVARTVERFGRVDILVNNAATNPHMGPLIALSEPAAAKTTRVNQYAPLLWTRLAWDAWMAKHDGVVLNIASVGGLIVDPDIGFYNATKAALMHLTRQLAYELGRRSGSTRSPRDWSRRTLPVRSGRRARAVCRRACRCAASAPSRTSPTPRVSSCRTGVVDHRAIPGHRRWRPGAADRCPALAPPVPRARPSCSASTAAPPSSPAHPPGWACGSRRSWRATGPRSTRPPAARTASRR